MTTSRAIAKTAKTTAKTFTSVRSGLLRRKCDCGGSEGLTAEFDNSQQRQLSSRPARIQTKLAISQPGDIYEQEADRMAEAVVGRSAKNSQHVTWHLHSSENESLAPK
jgi:hypothetical protein